MPLTCTARHYVAMGPAKESASYQSPFEEYSVAGGPRYLFSSVYLHTIDLIKIDHNSYFSILPLLSSSPSPSPIPPLLPLLLFPLSWPAPPFLLELGKVGV